MPQPEQDTAVRREIVLDAGRSDVWAALTDPDLLARWLADDVEDFEAEAGSQAVFSYEDGERREAIVERVEDESVLALRWWRADGVESRVELRLTDAVAGTRLAVIETPLSAPAWAPAAMVDVSWTPRLQALRKLLALQPALVAV
jgi:uncharacterized protein YndB with AHSA1/START domain